MTEEIPLRFEVFLPARLGPPRKRARTINGVKISVKVRQHELPPNQNDRLHHMVKAKIMADWRQASCAAAIEHQLPHLQRVKISAIIHRKVVGRADITGDYDRIKAPVDGLVDAKVIPDDRRSFVEYGTIEEQKQDARGLGITLIIEPLPEREGRHHGSSQDVQATDGLVN